MEKHYDLIALDWNGTLLDDAGLSAECISKVSRYYDGPGISLRKYRDVFRFPIIEYYEKIGLKDYFKEASNRYFECYNELKGRVKLFDDALMFIGFCRAIANDVVILTAGRQDIIQQEAFDHFVDLPAWGSSAMPSLGKLETAKDLHGWISYRTGFRKPRVLLVGDTIEDSCCANTLGWDFRAVDTGHCSRSRLLEQGRPVFSSLLEIKDSISKDLNIGNKTID